MAIQASEIIDYVANSLRDTGHTQYPVTELMGYLNRSIRYLALRLAVGWPAGA